MYPECDYQSSRKSQKGGDMLVRKGIRTREPLSYIRLDFFAQNIEPDFERKNPLF